MISFLKFILDKGKNPTSNTSVATTASASFHQISSAGIGVTLASVSVCVVLKTAERPEIVLVNGVVVVVGEVVVVGVVVVVVVVVEVVATGTRMVVRIQSSCLGTY